MGNLERNRSQSAFRIVPADLEGANPIAALVIAPHVRAALCDGVAFNWLVLKCLAHRRPIPERAVFKVKVQSSAVGPEGFYANRFGCERSKKGDDENRDKIEPRKNFCIHISAI